MLTRAESWNSIQVSPVDGKNPSTCSLPGCTLTIGWDGKCRRNLNLYTLIWNTAVTNSILTGAPKTYPGLMTFRSCCLISHKPGSPFLARDLAYGGGGEIAETTGSAKQPQKVWAASLVSYFLSKSSGCKNLECMMRAGQGIGLGPMPKPTRKQTRWPHNSQLHPLPTQGWHRQPTFSPPPGAPVDLLWGGCSVSDSSARWAVHSKQHPQTQEAPLPAATPLAYPIVHVVI